MAAFDLQEQEQIAELKAWWAKWGKFLVALVVALAVGFIGQYGWKAYRKSQAATAASLYATVEQAFRSKDATKTRAAADAMSQQLAGHALSSRAMLLAAKLAYDAQDLAKARSALEWVLAHAKEDGLLDVARLRLAAVQLDQKEYDAALGTLEKPQSSGFDSLFANARGDVLASKGDSAGARKAYEQALAVLEKDAPARDLIEVKLSALGAAK